MDDALLKIADIAGLSPKDAVIARALVRNNLLDTSVVVETATRIADESAQGLLERLTADGQLDALRAATIERALEKKLEERRASNDERPSPARTPKDRWTTPSGKRARLWQPRHKRDVGESSVILLNELKQRGAAQERQSIAPTTDLEVQLAASEAARRELEDRLQEMESAASEAQNHRAHVEAMKAMMETVKAEADRAKAQFELKEDFIEQLMQELTTQDAKRKQLEQENGKLKKCLTGTKTAANDKAKRPAKKSTPKRSAKKKAARASK